MVILETGLFIFRDDIASTMTYAQWGNGTTLESSTDTSLESPQSATQKTISVTVAGNSINTVHELTSTQGNENSLTEFELSQGTPTSLTRKTNVAVEKTSNKQLTTTTTIFVNVN